MAGALREKDRGLQRRGQRRNGPPAAPGRPVCRDNPLLWLRFMCEDGALPPPCEQGNVAHTVARGQRDRDAALRRRPQHIGQQAGIVRRLASQYQGGNPPGAAAATSAAPSSSH